jgi:Ca2+-dependent lipid-binding protein
MVGYGRNERFDIMVFDKESQYIDFNVWDYDVTGSNDSLGTATLKFEKLPKNETVELELDLSDTTSGSLIVSCEYIELQKVCADYGQTRVGDIVRNVK